MAASAKTIRKWEIFAEAYVDSKCGAKAAKVAGYTGKNNASLSAAGSRLLKKPEVKKIIASIRKELKAKPVPVPIEVIQREEHNATRGTMRVETEDKRALLWEVACHNGRVVTEEDIQEEIDDEGCTTRIITRTERVFDSQGCINAVSAMNIMDGDVKTPATGPGNNLSIENLLLSIGR